MIRGAIAFLISATMAVAVQPGHIMFAYQSAAWAYPTNGLTLYSKLLSPPTDEFGGHANGVPFGNAARTNGVDGEYQTAWYFDGVGDGISWGDDDDYSFNPNDAFSISVWIKPSTQLSTANMIVNKWSASGREYRFYISSSHIIACYVADQSIGDTSTRGLYATPALTVGEWAHIVWTYDGTSGSNPESGMAIYVNGSAATTATNNGAGSYVAMENTSAVLENANGSAGSDFKGSIDELYIYTRELTSDEVTTLYEQF